MAKVLTNRPAPTNAPAQQPVANVPVTPPAQQPVAVVPAQPKPLLPMISADARPAHLVQYTGDKGLLLIAQAVQLPRIKLVQKGTDAAIRKSFQDGTMVINIGGDIIKLGAGMADGQEGYSVPFIPVLYYPEWYALNEFKTKGTLPYVHDRTLDGKSEIARKSRVKDYSEPQPKFPGAFITYHRAMNFVIHPLVDDVPVNLAVLGFWKGDIVSGGNFATLIQQRGDTALWGNQFEMYSKWRPGSGKGDYFGVNVQNPESIGPFVENTELFEQLTALHESMQEAYETNMLQVDVDDTYISNNAESTQY